MFMKKNYFKKWKNDFEFRTIVNSFVSSGITVIFALYNLVIGIYYGASKYDKTDKAGRKKYTLRHRLI